MDPLTHGLLGASFGQALCGRALGRRALVWGAILGMAPDLDVVMNATGPTGEWLWHRGATHALLFGPVVGPPVGLGLQRWKGGALRPWTVLAMVALFSHPLLDLFTSYGTQLLAPFSRKRFALDAVAIIDPAYGLLLTAALAIGLWRGVATPVARRAAATALALSTGYIFLGLALNHRAEAVARKQLEGEGVRGARVHAYPTLLQLPLRRLVARRDLEVRVGWLSVLAPRPVVWERFEDDPHPLAGAARATSEGRVLEWFAMGETSAKVTASSEGTIVEIDDLRYGLPGRPRHGLWGLRIRFDGAGRPIGPGERIDRPLPASGADLLGQLARQTLGIASP